MIPYDRVDLPVHFSSLEKRAFMFNVFKVYPVDLGKSESVMKSRSGLQNAKNVASDAKI